MCSALAYSLVPTPVYTRATLHAVRCSSYERADPDGDQPPGAQGDLTNTKHMVWTRLRGTPYVPSMLLYEDALYFLKHYQNIITRVDGPTGKDQPGALRSANWENLFLARRRRQWPVY